jgi:hypothetical protein
MTLESILHYSTSSVFHDRLRLEHLLYFCLLMSSLSLVLSLVTLWRGRRNRR